MTRSPSFSEWLPASSGPSAGPASSSLGCLLGCLLDPPGSLSAAPMAGCWQGAAGTRCAGCAPARLSSRAATGWPSGSLGGCWELLQACLLSLLEAAQARLCRARSVARKGRRGDDEELFLPRPGADHVTAHPPSLIPRRRPCLYHTARASAPFARLWLTRRVRCKGAAAGQQGAATEAAPGKGVGGTGTAAAHGHESRPSAKKGGAVQKGGSGQENEMRPQNAGLQQSKS